ncbi:MBL fold metallo-hydrolase [Capnocytophaga cynodegmi]|uniref:MBL fold metallo-hydrolase n=1 Tax=Capnocytophaga cynodegmi TaxID=28189 RepID=UPI0038588567
MKLTILGSNSNGNGYVIQNEDEALILEAGIDVLEAKKALDFNVSKVQGLLITHEHSDHAKYAKKYQQSGFEIFASNGTLKDLKIKQNINNANALLPNKLLNIGNFKVLPFLVKHDVEEPFGFLIHHKEMGTLLFMTDTYRVDYQFKDVNHILIEANHCKHIIEEEFIKGSLAPARYQRLVNSHLNIQNCLSFLKNNDLSQTSNVVLIHLSDKNSNEEMFIQKTKEAIGKRVFIADKGLEINLNKTPF